MAVELWRSAKTKVANYDAVSYTPDILFEEDASVGNHYAAQINSIKQSGGGKDTEGIICFGGKTITQVKPQDDFEVEMDVIFTDTTFDQMLFGGTLTTGLIVAGTSYTSAGTNKRWRITICWQDPDAATEATSERLYWMFKDCYAVSWEPEGNAEEYMKGTIKFKVAAKDKNGIGNVIKVYTGTAGASYVATTSLFTTANGGALDSYTYTP